MKTGNRDKNSPNEALPNHEVIELKHTGNPFQVRFNFTIHTAYEDEMQRISFNYNYVNIEDLQPKTLQNEGVPQDVINSITG